MSINYFINKIKYKGGTHHVGHISLKENYNSAMLISRMLDMGTSLGKEDIMGVISLLKRAVHDICLEGNSVTIDEFMRFTPAISGTFDRETDGFDKSRNEVYLTAQISRACNKSFSNLARTEKVMAADKKPYLYEVSDNETGASNSCVTKNDIVSLFGAQMKFDCKSQDEYLRFVNAGNTTEYTAINKCRKITDKEIIFLMPAVPYLNGYFELGARRGTGALRVGRSSIVEVK